MENAQFQPTCCRKISKVSWEALTVHKRLCHTKNNRKNGQNFFVKKVVFLHNFTIIFRKTAFFLQKFSFSLQQNIKNLAETHKKNTDVCFGFWNVLIICTFSVTMGFWICVLNLIDLPVSITMSLLAETKQKSNTWKLDFSVRVLQIFWQF